MKNAIYEPIPDIDGITFNTVFQTYIKPAQKEIPILKWLRVDVDDIVMGRSILVKDGYDAVFCLCGYTLYFPKVKELGIYQIVCPDCGHVAHYHHLRNTKG